MAALDSDMHLFVHANPLDQLLPALPRPGLLIQRYLVKEYLLYFLISFLFFFAIFFVNQILVLARNQFAEQVPLFDVLRLMIFALPAIIALAVPYASFIGVILAIGKFSEGREILAARASGIGLSVLLLPVLSASFLLGVVSFTVNDYLLPLSIMNYTRLYQELLYSNPRLVIEPYAIRKYSDSILITGAVEDTVIDGILIFDKTDSGTDRTISADRAELLRNDQQQGIITLALSNVEMISVNDSIIQDSFAESMEYNILLENIVFSIHDPTVREMSVRDVFGLILKQELVFQEQLEQARLQYHLVTADFQTNYFAYAMVQRSDFRSKVLQDYQALPQDPDKFLHDSLLRLYRLEFWKKFSLPLASLTFILLGFPLGLLALRVGRNIGIFSGFLIGGLYWGLLTLNEFAAIEFPFIPAILLTFSPNIMMAAVGSLLLYFYFKN